MVKNLIMKLVAKLAAGHRWRWSLLSLLTFLVGQACEPAFYPTENASLTAQSESFLSAEEAQACQGSRVPTAESLKNITDLVDYLNALPRPLQLHCVIAGLPRPLQLTAGVSSGSAQPSLGMRNPRIIIKVGSLLLGVVPDGPARGSLEVGAIKAGDSAARAEFLFPISDADLQESAGLGHIRFGAGTTCGLCHAGETAATGELAAGVYQSKIIRFNSAERTGVVELKAEAELCRGQNTDRCLLLRALFQGAAPQDAEY